MSLRASAGAGAGGIASITAGNGLTSTGGANPTLTALSSAPTQTTVASPGTALTTGVTANVTSKALGIGTYLVWGVIDFLCTTATVTNLQGGIGSATAVLLGQPGGGGVGPDPNVNIGAISTPATTTETISITSGPTIVTLAGAASVFLNAQATFSAGTVSAFGTLSIVQLK